VFSRVASTTVAVAVAVAGGGQFCFIAIFVGVDPCHFVFLQALQKSLTNRGRHLMGIAIAVMGVAGT
jgi:hypothetical protein